VSHFTKVKSKIKNLTFLKKALTSLGYAFQEAEAGQTLEIKGWEGEKTKAVLEINPGCSYGIGVIVNEDETCELVADWWAIETYTERKQEDFVKEITKQYAYETVMDKVKKAGYSTVTEEQDDKDQIHIVLRKWG
jgi:hypothetical protein